MKKYTAVLNILTFFVVCSAMNGCGKTIFPLNDRKIDIEKVLHNAPNELSPHGKKKGRWIIFLNKDWKPVENRSNAYYFRILNYKNGSPTGIVRDYYMSNGAMQWQGILLSENPDVIRDGISKFYWKTGKKSSEGELIKNQKEGLWTEWDEVGNKTGEGNYIHGIPEGKWTLCHPDGEKLAEGTLIDNQREGLWTEWDENGNKIREGTYIKGKTHGKWVYWHDNGKKSAEGEYKNGQKNGLWTKWYETGEKSTEENFKNGKAEGRWTFWYTNGEISAEGEFRYGRPNGAWIIGATDGSKIFKID